MLVHRLGDICSGHGCWWPRPAITGSLSVFVNFLPVHRVADWYAVHACPGSKQPPHSAMGVTGSATVFVEFRPLRRMGDALTTGGPAPLGPCSGVAITGSPNTFCGI